MSRIRSERIAFGPSPIAWGLCFSAYSLEPASLRSTTCPPAARARSKDRQVEARPTMTAKRLVNPCARCDAKRPHFGVLIFWRFAISTLRRFAAPARSKRTLRLSRRFHPKTTHKFASPQHVPATSVGTVFQGAVSPYVTFESSRFASRRGGHSHRVPTPPSRSGLCSIPSGRPLPHVRGAVRYFGAMCECSPRGSGDSAPRHRLLTRAARIRGIDTRALKPLDRARWGA